MKRNKAKFEKADTKAPRDDRNRLPRKRKKKQPRWVPTPVAVAEARRELIQGGIERGTENLKLALQLLSRRNSAKWKAVIVSHLADSIAADRKRELCSAAPPESRILWLLPEFKAVPTRISAGKQRLAIRDATLGQLRKFTDSFATRSTRDEKKLSELRRLVEHVSAAADGDQEFKVGDAFPNEKLVAALAKLKA